MSETRKNPLIRSISMIIPAGILTSGVSLVDQIFAANIAEQILNLHAIVITIPLVFLTLGKAIGHSYIIMSKKLKEQYGENRIFSGYLLFGSTASIVLLLSTIPVSSRFIDAYSLGSLRESEPYFFLQSIAGSLALITSLFTYKFIADKSFGNMFVSNLIAFLANLLGNTLSLTFLDTEYQMTCGLALSSIGSFSLSLISQIYLCRSSFHSLILPINYFKKARTLITGQAQSFTLAILTPMGLLYAFQTFYSKEVSSIYSFATSLIHFISIPILATTVIGSGALAEAYSNRSRPSFENGLTDIKQISKVVCLIPILFIVTSHMLIAFVLKIDPSLQNQIVISAFLCQALGFCYTAPFLAELRVAEKQQSIANMEAIADTCSILVALGGGYMGVPLIPLIFFIVSIQGGKFYYLQKIGRRSSLLPQIGACS